MSLILDALQFGFFQRALMVGFLLAIIYALLGNFVVLREEAIIGHTMANIVFMGIALGLLLSWDSFWIMILAALAGVLFIDYLQRSSRFSRDSILALTSQISIAAGIIILSQVEGYQNVEGFLFGNILAVSSSDLWMSLALFLINIVGLFLFRKQLTQLVINKELAISAGTNVERVNFIFMLLLALTVAAGIKIIGVILLAAFLVIPANIAKNIASSFKQMVLLSVIVSVIGVFAGLFLSYYFDTPSGAMIVLVLGVMLIVTNVFKRR